MHNRETFLRIEDVSDWTGISPNTLRYWKHEGIGPKCAKLGRRIVYRERDVQEWLDAQFDGAASR